MRRSRVVVKEKIVSMAAWASLASRDLESPAMESGSISKMGSMPTQMGDFFESMAARRRSEKISSMGGAMIAEGLESIKLGQRNGSKFNAQTHGVGASSQ